MQGSSSRFCPSLSGWLTFCLRCKKPNTLGGLWKAEKEIFLRGTRGSPLNFKWVGASPGDVGTWTWCGMRNVATRADKDTHSGDIRRPRWMTAGWTNRYGQSCRKFLWFFLHILTAQIPPESGYHISALLLGTTKLARNFQPSYANVLLLYRATKFHISHRT